PSERKTAPTSAMTMPRAGKLPTTLAATNSRSGTRRIYRERRRYPERMAVRPIRITGDPVLHERADEVAEIDDDLRRLVADMEETMHAAPGVGLAAPQVGVPLRLFVYSWTDDDGVLHA